MPSARPIILCPLHVERRALLAGWTGDAIEVSCCGPGHEGIARWAGANRRLDRPVILAGLAGSLVEDHRPGDVVEVTGAVRPGAPVKETTWRLPGRLELPRVLATSSTRLVNSRPAKRALHSTLGAGVVDMESLTFVQKGLELGWQFGIVRAISDGLDDTLPPGCDRWVDHRGRVAPAAVLSSVLRSPSLVGRMREMGRLTTSAMGRLAGVLQQAFAEPER